MGVKYKEFENYLRNLNMPIINVVPTLSEEIDISDEIKIPSFGLKHLVDITYSCIDEAAQKAFINAQKVDLERKVIAARIAVIPYVTANFATGFTPIPFSDVAILVPSQMGMIANLTVIFGLTFDKAFISAIVTAVGGVGGATLIGKTIVANALKFLPGFGTVAGGLISGTTAAILTAALGFAYIEVLNKIVIKIYNGQKIDNNEIINMMKKAYEEQLKMGKSIIGDMNLS